jgi:glutamyl-tRNA synthetase
MKRLVIVALLLRLHCNSRLDECWRIAQITLMDWGNAIVRKIVSSSPGLVDSIVMELHLAGDFKKTDKKITWLAIAPDAPKLIDATLVDFDYLLTKKKIEDGEDWLNFLTPVTEFRKEALVDSNCSQLEAGTAIQFERKGYYILDSVKHGGANGKEVIGMEFFLIPDGKAGTVASKAERNTTSGITVGTGTATAGTAAIAPSGTTGLSDVKSSSEGASGPSSAMYTVKAVNDEGPVRIEGLKMYKVKPVYWHW